MIRLDNEKNRGENMTDEFEIDTELATIVEQNMLSPRIAEKIGEKLKESNIKINKEQFYKLVKKIQTALQIYSKSSQSGEKKKDKIEITPNEDMQKLVETIEKLKDRIKIIEGNQLDGVTGLTGKIVKTKDIKTGEKIELSLQEEMESLTEISNDPESIVVLMKWLQYLVDKLGKNNLPEILDYYVDINWISDDVRLDLIKYSKGITVENEKEESKKEVGSLSTRDHVQSLLFIQKLKGNQLDERFIWKIDREMEKMAKSIEGYKFK